MTAVELVSALRARGVELVAAGDRLRFRPSEAVTSEEREALRCHKAEVLRLLARVLESLALDAVTLRAVLGPRPEPEALATLEVEIRQAIATYRTEVATDAIGPKPVLVRGRPLADYLDLDTVGRLIQARGSVSRPRSHCGDGGAGHGR
jgi:hypothetical protein